MPPNRKANAEIAQGIASLTNAHLQLVVPVANPSSSKTAVFDSASYWEWPADETLQQLQEEEARAELFSIQHITDNLVQAALKAQQPRQECEQHASDDYWNPCHVASTTHIVQKQQQQQQQDNCCCSEEEERLSTKSTHPQHDQYWQWEAFPERARNDANHPTTTPTTFEDEAQQR